MKKVNLFVDMDGVLAVYEENVENLMYDKNFFLERPVVKPVVQIVKDLIQQDKYNIYILTSVIDSPYCVEEKAKWLDKVLPEIDKSNRIYVPYGEVKAEYAKANVPTEGFVNVLLDDYTENLIKWKIDGALPIKLMNGINGTNGTWAETGGAKIDAFESVDKNVNTINALVSLKLG